MRRARQDAAQSGNKMLECVIPKDAWMTLVENDDGVNGVEHIDMVTISDSGLLLQTDFRHHYVGGPINSNFEPLLESSGLLLPRRYSVNFEVQF